MWKYRKPDDGYWEVTTRDGVRYELGATEDSRFTTRAPAWSYWTQPGYTDKTTRWRLNRVVYPSGGEVSYTYWKQRYTDQCDLFKSREWSGTDFCETPNFVSNTTDRASYISEIGYGQTKVAFDWAYRKDAANLNDGFAEQAWKAWPANGMWALSWQTHALTGVRVLQRDSSGVWQTTNRWALEHAIHEPSGADSQPLRVLAGIRAYGLNGAEQPGVTFGYTGYPNWAQYWPDPSKDWSIYGYPYPRLSAIDAGTGATITIQYETPDTLYLGRQNPDLDYNYRVVTKMVGDGLGGGMLLRGFWMSAALGIVQGASFASIPELNPTVEGRARASGAVAQLGNLGTTTGTPVLAALLAWGGAGVLIAAGVGFCAAGIGIHRLQMRGGQLRSN